MADAVVLALVVVALVGAHLLVRDLRTLPRAVGRRSDVAVVVPARDEATTLPHLLVSLARSEVRPAETVVVDDASRDATAAVARAAGATVLTAGAPPPGWTGKAWACHRGAGATAGDLLLFLDADTVLAPDALAGLLELHDRHGGLVSVQPFHAVERPYEQLSAYFNLMAVLGSGAFTGRATGPAMAFGPCLLSTRADYERAGGHAVVRGEVLDDVRLAFAYQRAGLPVRCAVGGDALRMRSYPGGLGQLVAGWTKNIASGAGAAAPVPALGSVLWVSAHHAVAVGAVLALLGGDHLLLWALAWLAVAVQLRSLLRRVGAFRWWTWLLFPLPLLAFDLVFARSLVSTAVRRSVHWRGRVVDLRRDPSAEERA